MEDESWKMLANAKKLKQGGLSSKKNESQILETFMAYESIRGRWDEFIAFLKENASKIVEDFEAS